MKLSSLRAQFISWHSDNLRQHYQSNIFHSDNCHNTSNWH
jgi:hypothetical protein